MRNGNKDARADTVVTRLYYAHVGGMDYVEDFSFFANEKYMSESLLDAIRNNKTLTEEQEDELKPFIIECTYNSLEDR